MVPDIIDPAVMTLEVYQHALEEGIDMFLKSDVSTQLIEQLGAAEDPEAWCSVFDAFVKDQQYFDFSSANLTMGDDIEVVTDTIEELNMAEQTDNTEEPRDTEDLGGDYPEFLALTPGIIDEGEDYSESFALTPEIIAEYEILVPNKMDDCLPLSAQEPIQEDPGPILRQSDNPEPVFSNMNETVDYQPTTQGPSCGLDYSPPFFDSTWNHGQLDTSFTSLSDGNQFFNQHFEGQYPINMQPVQSALYDWLNHFHNPQQMEFYPSPQVSPRAFPSLVVIQNFGNTAIHN